MKYNVISGDCHIDLSWLPADVFTANAPARLKDRVPRVVETNNGPTWMAGDIDMGGVAGSGFRGGRQARGASKHIDEVRDMGFFDDAAKGILRATDPQLRRKDMEADGVDAEVIYGIISVGERLNHDPELLTYVYQAYNDWLAGFCNTMPDRVKGLACVSHQDPEVAAGELRRAAGLGLAGAVMDAPITVKPLYHRVWDVLWATAAETNMPISFHTKGWEPRAPDPEDAEAYKTPFSLTRGAMFHVVPGCEYLASIIFSGACDRYPDFKFVLGECGVSWIPYAISRMDHLFENKYSEQGTGLRMRPSEYWRRQGFSTFQEEFYAGDIAQVIGVDNMLWGSDYPHGDGVWPESQRIIQRDLGKLAEPVLRKIICENSGKLYGFIK